MSATPEFILYVADQARAREFYAAVLGQDPVLDVPGMTEFDLGGALLGLMPQADIADLLGVAPSGEGQRCELYLRRPDAADVLARAATAGGRILSDLAPPPLARDRRLRPRPRRPRPGRRPADPQSDERSLSVTDANYRSLRRSLCGRHGRQLPVPEERAPASVTKGRLRAP